MKQALLWTIGRVMSAPPVFALLRKLAPPHVHLYDLDGPMYMGRWSVIDEFVRVNNKDTKVRTRASRVLQALTGYASIRLHWIRRADHDRELHNHPFDYRTFILKGMYTEEYEEPGVHDSTLRGYRWVHQGGTATGSKTKFHRIDLVPSDGVWTLFCMTPNTNTWGFKTQAGFMKSARYFLMKGYGRNSRGTGKL